MLHDALADPRVLAPIVVMVFGLAAALWAERADRVGPAFAAKGAASLAFVALGALADAPGRILAALVLSLVGDLLLVPRDRRVFRAGILVFLLAHVAYVAAFLQRGVSPMWVAVSLVVLAPLGFMIARWLWPRVPPALRGAVAAYVVVIAAMVAFAAGTGDVQLLVAAALFWTNDLLVARDRFVQRAFLHRLVGLPMYYAAQVLFALSA